MDANRTGGEDLVVLGCHIFDLARLFAGDAHWCTAWVRQSGHDATLVDVKGSAGGEGIGPILGDEINAQFGMDGGVLLSFTSRNAQLGTTGQLPCESELPHSAVSGSLAIISLLLLPVCRLDGAGGFEGGGAGGARLRARVAYIAHRRDCGGPDGAVAAARGHACAY